MMIAEKKATTTPASLKVGPVGMKNQNHNRKNSLNKNKQNKNKHLTKTAPKTETEEFLCYNCGNPGLIARNCKNTKKHNKSHPQTNLTEELKN